MTGLNDNQSVFISLLSAGLWKTVPRLNASDIIDYTDVLNMAERQSVVGIVAAGIEQLSNNKAPKEVVLSFVGYALQLEQRNLAMNKFLSHVITLLKEAGVQAILVKGQGIAQCYERPLWRENGDIDLLLSANDYYKAKSVLKKYAISVDEEDRVKLHQAMNVDGWTVELHGTLHGEWSKRVDSKLDVIQKDVLSGGYHSWQNGQTEVLVPSINNNILIIFTHILQHYYVGGIGLRQICDWCRLLWTYKTEVDKAQLKTRLIQMEIMNEWKAFGVLAVEYLGMPTEAMPFYDEKAIYKKKAKNLLSLVMDTGNFGHNRDMSYKSTEPFYKRIIISLSRHLRDLYCQFFISPKNSLLVLQRTIYNGFFFLIKGDK